MQTILWILVLLLIIFGIIGIRGFFALKDLIIDYCYKYKENIDIKLKEDIQILKNDIFFRISI